MHIHRRFVAGAAALSLLAVAPSFAQNQGTVQGNARGDSTRSAGAAGSRQNDRGDVQQVRKELSEAVQVVRNMQKDPELARQLKQAKGLFILPDYGRAALGVGGQGGQGVLVTRSGSGFGNPVFFNLGGVSLGLQAGVSAGQVAMLLMTDRAVQDFRSDKNFSLNADAGLTIGTWSARGQASGGKVQDVIFWSNAKGAYGGASVAVTDVTYDGQANTLFYGQEKTSAADILDGRLKPKYPNPLAKVLG